MTELERLEVYTADGVPTGVVKSRPAIHADGDWHIAAFVWVFDGRGRVVLQRRSPDKATWPGRWDASAAGHVQAAEPIEEAARRELAEELGLDVALDAFVRAAPYRQEHRHRDGLVDREHHAVFFVRADQPLVDYRPGPEVTAVAQVDARDLLAFARGADVLPVIVRETSGAGVARAADPGAVRVLSRDELVVYEPEYLARIAERVLALTAS